MKSNILFLDTLTTQFTTTQSCPLIFSHFLSSPSSNSSSSSAMPSSAAPYLLVLVLVLFSVTTVNSVGAEEGEALLRFKATLSIDLISWIPGPAPCFLNHTNWEGVLCFNSRVWGIQLENRDLQGTLNVRPLIPLRGLRTISFMGNSLEGNFPIDIGRLGALKAVYLSRNNFSGEIPGEVFAGMRSLKKVFLSYNGFEGMIPGSIVGLEKLIEVRLDHNKFAGGIPEFAQRRLLIVDVSFNGLEGRIPSRLSKMDPGLFQGNPKLCGAPLTLTCNNNNNKNKNKLQQPKRVISRWGFSLLILTVCFTSFLLLLFLFIFLRRLRKTSKVIGRPLTTGDHTPENPNLVPPVKPHPPHPTPAHVSEAGKTPAGRKSEYGRLIFVQQGRERFELDELLRASAEVLGSGNFGSSFKAVLSAGPTVVVKRFKEMNRVGREDFSEHMRRIGRLSHANLLPLIAYYYKKEDKLLVTQFIANGSLAHMLHGNRGSSLPPLDWPTRLKIVKGVARGLAYLYDELPMLTLPHGHLKSTNVLLDETLAPLLTDYALIPVINLTRATQLMISFKSPEFSRSAQISKKSDVWSLGILILEILTGKFPANFSRFEDLATWVSSGMGEVFDCDMKGIENGGREIENLLKIGIDCCEETVEKRLEMREALERIEQIRERDC